MVTLGVDNDGVIFDTLPVMHEYARQYTEVLKQKAVPLSKPINPNSYFLHEVFGWPIEYEEKFFCIYLLDILRNAPLKPEASFYLKKLRAHGIRICILTARNNERTPNFSPEEIQEVTLQAYRDHNIEVDEIIFMKGKKSTWISKLGIVSMMEDSPSQVLEISKLVPVICFEEMYNKSLSGECIYPVKGWRDAYTTFMKQII